LKDGQKVLVFEFWATWCPPCRTSIPHLTQLAKKFEGKVIVVGISSEDETTVRTFVNSLGSKMDYVVAIDSEMTARKNYLEPFRIRGIPHAFIIGKDGTIVWHGHPMENEMYLELEKAVNMN